MTFMHAQSPLRSIWRNRGGMSWERRNPRKGRLFSRLPLLCDLWLGMGWWELKWMVAVDPDMERNNNSNSKIKSNRIITVAAVRMCP